MASQVAGVRIRDNDLGARVERATAVLPQTATAAIFTVTGRIILTCLVGTVTTLIQNQANNTSVAFVPSSGTAVTLTAVDLANLEVGGLISLSGTATVKATAGGILLGPPDPGFVVSAGSISLTTAASNTGSVRWSLNYLPMDSGASVVAV